jgi:hypothetical protein
MPSFRTFSESASGTLCVPPEATSKRPFHTGIGTANGSQQGAISVREAGFPDVSRHGLGPLAVDGLRHVAIIKGQNATLDTLMSPK